MYYSQTSTQIVFDGLEQRKLGEQAKTASRSTRQVQVLKITEFNTLRISQTSAEDADAHTISKTARDQHNSRLTYSLKS